MKIIHEVDKQLHKAIEDIRYSDIKTNEQKSSFLMTKEEIQEILPEPPSNLSGSTYSDLIELSMLTADINEQQRKFIMSVDDKVENAFRPFLDKFNLEFPDFMGRNQSFFKDFARDIEIVKYYYNRPRPEQLADKYGIKINVIKTESIKTPAYPSGHSVYGYLLEKMLSDMYPIHAQDFAKMAESVGMARKMQGVHFDSDVQAAKLLVNKTYHKIQKMIIDKGE